MDALTAALVALEENPPPRGDPGERGLKGELGPIGPRGPQGPKGDPGERGPDGRDGQDGEPGPKGDRGDSGNDGQSVERAEAYGLPPDRPPVAVFDSGLLRLGIPRGRRGPPGPAGYGGGSSGSVHPNLTAHHALGLATDAALAAHVATPHPPAWWTAPADQQYFARPTGDAGFLWDVLADYGLVIRRYPDVIMADSPVAYWRLGETSGNPQDSAGTNHVTTVGGTPTYGVTGALTGDSDKAVTLDAPSEYFEVPDAAALDLGDGPLSIELWVKRATQGAGQQELVNKGTNAYSININGDTVNRWTLTKVGVTVICESTTTLDTNWHHLVATRNGGATAKLYQDGVDVSGSSSATAFADNASVLGIGRDPAGILPFTGSLDEIAIYNVVLTADRVAAHYAARTL